MSLKEESIEKKIQVFVLGHPKPSIRLATTLKKGAAVCIAPIPTICGPEIMCRPEDKLELIKMLKD